MWFSSRLWEEEARLSDCHHSAVDRFISVIPSIQSISIAVQKFRVIIIKIGAVSPTVSHCLHCTVHSALSDFPSLAGMFPAITLCWSAREPVPVLADDCNLISLQAQRSHDLQFILVINYQGVASLSIPNNYTENILAGRSAPRHTASMWYISYQCKYYTLHGLPIYNPLHVTQILYTN